MSVIESDVDYMHDDDDESDIKPRSNQLLFYFSPVSPYSHKVELALVEAKASFFAHNLDRIPRWFVSEVNPLGKVPALSYLHTHAAGAMVLLEFIADHHTDAKLMPEDAFLRSRVRFFVKLTTSLLESPVYAFFTGATLTYDGILEGVLAIQQHLNKGSLFAVGDHYTIADAFISAVIARLRLITDRDTGEFPAGLGTALGEELKREKYATFMQYAERMMERPSMKHTNKPDKVDAAYPHSNKPAINPPVVPWVLQLLAPLPN